MTKTPFNIMQEGGVPGKEETYAFIDATTALKPVEIPGNDPKTLENNAYREKTKKLLKKKTNIYPLCGLLMASVLLVWLVGLTMVREFQLSDLRKNIEELRSDLEELKQNLIDDSLVDELKGFEEEVNRETDRRLPKRINLYDDALTDDEDFEEDDITDGSGGFSEYDGDDESSKETGMEAIDQIDFLGEVMEATLQDKSQSSTDLHPPIRKVMRILPDDGELKEKYSRSKREVFSQTANGIPVLEESYAATRARNLSHEEYGSQPHISVGDGPRGSPKMLMDWNSEKGLRQQHKRKHYKKFQSGDATTASPGPVFSRSSRVMQTDQDSSKAFRRVIRIRKPIIRSGPAADYDAAYLQRKPEEIGVKRIRRFRKHGPQNPDSESIEELYPEVRSQRLVPSGQSSNQVMAAHFSGDTRDMQIGKHEDYDGNGRLRHPMEVPYTKWSAASWLPSLGLDTHFPLENGAVTVPENGLYFVYAQVYFHDSHDTNGFKVYRNNRVGDEAILQCATMTHSKERITKANTCYTAGVFHLTRADTIFLQNMGSMRYSIMQPGKSFFGLVKLGDAKIR